MIAVGDTFYLSCKHDSNKLQVLDTQKPLLVLLEFHTTKVWNFKAVTFIVIFIYTSINPEATLNWVSDAMAGGLSLP